MPGFNKFILSLFLVTKLSAQEQILTATIMDKRNFDVVPGATVVVGDPGHTIMADKVGRLRFKSSLDPLPVIVTAAGYEKLSTYIYRSGRNDIFMLPALTSMSEVVVTGTMRTVQKTASPVPVEVYTPKFFLKNPTPTIFDALQMVNGV